MEKSVGTPWTPLPSELKTRWGVSLSRIGAHLHLPQIDRCRSLKTRGQNPKAILQNIGDGCAHLCEI